MLYQWGSGIRSSWTWRLVSAMLEQNGPASHAVIAEIATRPDLLHIVAALGSMLGLAAHKLAEESHEERDASGWLRFLAPVGCGSWRSKSWTAPTRPSATRPEHGVLFGTVCSTLEVAV